VVPAEQVVLRGVILTRYDIKARARVGGGSGARRPGTTPDYLHEIIKRLNSLFGDAAPLMIGGLVGTFVEFIRLMMAPAFFLIGIIFADCMTAGLLVRGLWHSRKQYDAG